MKARLPLETRRGSRKGLLKAELQQQRLPPDTSSKFTPDPCSRGILPHARPQTRAGLCGNAGGGAVRGARRNPESLRSMRGRRRWRRPRRPPRPRIAQEHAAGTADYCRQTAESLRSMRRRPRVTGPAPRGTYFVGIPFSALSLETSSQFTQVGALPAGSLDWRPWRRGAHTARNAE